MQIPHYIALEGPIGVGKTSLARRLAEDLNARLVLEQPEENPFLPKFYESREQNALTTQIAFLLMRYQQQKELRQTPLFEQTTICDYSFAKDWIFASLNLREDELNLFKKISSLLGEEMLKPDLLIYLQAEPELLRKHIKKRKVPYEKHMNLEYIEDVLEAYNQFFFNYNDTPLLVVNCTEMDFVNNDDQYESLVREIVSKKRGNRHYVAIGG